MTKLGLVARMMVVKIEWGRGTVDMVLVEEGEAKHFIDSWSPQKPQTEEEIRAKAVAATDQMQGKLPQPFQRPEESVMPPELMAMLMPMIKQFTTPSTPPSRSLLWSMSVTREQYEAMGSPRLFDIVDASLKVARGEKT